MESQPAASLSPVSYKSTHSSRSSVLERAREYNRRIEDQKQQHGLLGIQQPASNGGHYQSSHYGYHLNDDHRRRSKSLERGSLDPPFGITGGNSHATGSVTSGMNTNGSTAHSSQQQLRSQSAGRAPQYYSYHHHHHNNHEGTSDASPTRNRAVASVPRSHHNHQLQPPSATSASYHPHNNNNSFAPPAVKSNPHSYHTNNNNSNNNNHESTRPPQQRYNNINNNNSSSALTPTTATTATHSSSGPPAPATRTAPTMELRPTSSRLLVDEKKEESQTIAEPPNNNGPVVTPELLVDALSGHEDGLLAIAEKLMEHYDAGYDVMGEAIIDAFADVQKLFQHVVEAAHMEGAAFEAARREEEVKQRQKDGGSLGDGSIVAGSDHNRLPMTPGSPPSGGPTRHDEFIDQDVKDVLADAIRQGSTLRAERKDTQCYQLYTSACQDASSLLPVDSDHRGRLQLSIARAESMSPDRACAILRYAMDDVLRSGLRAHHPTPIPDPSHRADVVLNRSMTAGTGNNAIVQQSNDEALASLMEELKDILQAPIYHDTPLQHVASRFWNALAESQKIQHRNEARLEQNLGKLKGEFLLARAEWEEKLSQSNVAVENYRQKYEQLLVTAQKEGFAERSFTTTRTHDGTTVTDESNNNYHNIDLSSVYGSVKSAASKAETVASGVSGFAQHARSLVMNSGFNCVAPSNSDNRRHHDNDDGDDGMLDSQDSGEFDSNPPVPHQRSTAPVPRGRSTNSRSRSRPKATSQNQRFQEYSRSPHRLDV